MVGVGSRHLPGHQSCVPNYQNLLGGGVHCFILLPNNQRQYRNLSVQKDALPYALC